MFATKVEEETCPECGEEALFRSKKEEASGWKVYVQCDECGTDFGRIGFVKMSEIDHRDEVSEKAEELVRNFTG